MICSGSNKLSDSLRKAFRIESGQLSEDLTAHGGTVGCYLVPQASEHRTTCFGWNHLSHHLGEVMALI